ncbi:hypothetical protein [Azospirillum endophyticum]|uniref:hypothetical protein n=1 Tax=Azospirillum endophyticum TaxID=2800326 RepID=UPI001B3BF98B|nr:hypothetical protein [Azospirillum endophyticum]
MVITFEDCVGMSGLTKEEIDAIAAHEHLPEIVAAELGSYLVATESGQGEIRRMIEDDIAEAQAHGQHGRTAVLKLALCHFLQEHAAARTVNP